MTSAENFTQSAKLLSVKGNNLHPPPIPPPPPHPPANTTHPHLACIMLTYFSRGLLWNILFIQENNVQYLTLVLQNLDIYPDFANRAVLHTKPLLKKLADLDLHCLSISMWICINNLDQVIWLAENYKLVQHLNLFSRTKVKKKRSIFRGSNSSEKGVNSFLWEQSLSF